MTGRGTREQQDGIHSTWDVFDAVGEFTGQVAFACEGRGEKDALFLPGHGLAVLVKEHTDARLALRGGGTEGEEAEEESSPLEVICYRIVP